MFKAFYNLKGEPFGKSLQTSELFQSTQSKEALSRLDYMKNAKGLMLFTGHAGTGKTTCLKTFIDTLNPSHYKPIYLPLASVNVIEFYRQLNYALGGDFIHRKSDIFMSIHSLITDLAKNSNITPIIIFDEAHFLISDNFHELQMLLNFDFDSYDPALVILCGQPVLKDKLSRPAFLSIEHRIVLKFELAPLSELQTKDYIIHHLKLKGRKDPLFTDNALLAVHKISNGIKRMINKLSLKALMYGVVKKASTIDEEIIYQAVKEL